MADVQPLRALHYDLARVGALGSVVSPPYDGIDAEERARLAAQSPYNVVHIDLAAGPDPYRGSAELLERWQADGILVRDEQPALWALTQDFDEPDGGRRTRHGILCRVRIEDYGAGRIRSHERTHPAPQEDRLRLTRATRANLSPVFALVADPGRRSWSALEPHLSGPAWGEAPSAGGTINRLWRVTDPAVAEEVHAALADRELLIADGHHRYEAARLYAEEVGGEGAHRYVLMCVVALEDPGLAVYPTHRLIAPLDDQRRAALRRAIEESFEITEVATDELVPNGSDALQIGYLDARERRPLRLTLRDPARVRAALPDRSDAYRQLDTAMLEALLLRDALGMDEEAIAHLDGLDYARDAASAIESVREGRCEAAFFMAPTPVGQIQAVAAAGENMPPKSTYFLPKVPTGLLFNPLTD